MLVQGDSFCYFNNQKWISIALYIKEIWLNSCIIFRTFGAMEWRHQVTMATKTYFVP